MSLRLRLILAFLAVASLLLLVGVSSFVIQRSIETQIASLRSVGGIDLRNVDIEKVGLEIEGYWDRSGSFVSNDVEVLGVTRRPKLRGAIQAIDQNRKTVMIFGTPIQILPDTDFVDSPAGSGLESLKQGQRIEITCRVRDSVWDARKIQIRSVKESDKVKGTATLAEIDGHPPESLEIHGLRVSLAAAAGDHADSAMRRIEYATQMALALHESRAAAHDLVGRPTAKIGEGDETGRDQPATHSDADRLVQAGNDFRRYLQQSYAAGESAKNLASENVWSRWLRPLDQRQPVLSDHVATLLRLAVSDSAEARKFLDHVFDPFVSDELQPLVAAYLSEAEESLGDELRSISSRIETTTGMALATSGVAVVVAFVLWWAVWRSISRPLHALGSAAEQIGKGQFDTRVEVESSDEFGVLAEAFNQMAHALAGTTVSVTNLESVIDSMAGALIILDPDSRISSVNRAALQLLGFARSEILGRNFAEICPENGNEAPQALRSRDDGIVAIEEKTFVRKDGSEFPVSFSGAELRSEEGETRGFVCVAQDLSERKQIEQQIRSSLREKEVLIREVHHRVKNNMQVISSLLELQASYVDDPEVAENFEQSLGRIRSMALIHEQLFQAVDLAELDVRDYLESLTSHLLQSFGRQNTIEIELKVDDFSADVDEAISCGLIINELVTNALKYAFGDEESGRIQVSLLEASEGRRVLRVADDGRGMDEPGPSGRPDSLGMSLVHTLAQQLSGQIEIATQNGTDVRISFLAAKAERVVS